jgi:heme/copper-type cytochrome/quinol oxidase subunit 4
MQTRLSSLAESVINVVVGFMVSLVLTAIVLPTYGHPVSFADNVEITTIFTIASIIRSYVLRRFFNRLG